jgi:hypothetical protein
MSNLLFFSALVFLLIQPTSSYATAYPKNCFIVAANLHASEGLLCIDGIEKLDSHYSQVGDQMNAYFYVNNDPSGLADVLPLKITEIKPVIIGRYLIDVNIFLSGSNSEYEIQIHFSSRIRNALPVYSQRAGFISGKIGRQIIERYTWDESYNQPKPRECVATHPGACKL